MTVLVAIPYWHAEPFIERAVRSVLEQTERDLVVLVCGDGDTPPVAIHDDRLVIHTIPAWHGAPFVQQAMLLGSPFEAYAPFGADDWADPDHLELLASHGPNVAAGALWWHVEDKSTPHHVWDHGGRRLYEVGCYRAEDLRAVGGYGAQEQCSQDVLLLTIMARAIGLRHTTRPTYHRVRRAGSLTTRPDTGIHSKLRGAIRRRNRAVLAHCGEEGWIAPGAVDGPLPLEKLAGLREYRRSLIPAGLRGELDEAAGAIAGVLA